VITAQISEIIDVLTYRSYRFNRLRSPDRTPEQWAKVYDDAAVLEMQFQAELGCGEEN
jgi:hypothetical protein